MSDWDNALKDGGKWVDTKVGTVTTVTIVEINKVSNPDSDENLKTYKRGNEGYYWEFVCEEGLMRVNNWKMYFALRDAGVNVGDTIKVSHPSKGVYEIEKLGQKG